MELNTNLEPHRKGPFRLVVSLVIASLLVWGLSPLRLPFGLGALAKASNVSNYSDTLSTSAPSTTATHTISFKTPTGITAGQTITLTFNASFGTVSSIVYTDVTWSGKTLGATASGSTWGVSSSGQVITITSGTDTVAGGTTITLVVGGAHKITNPGSVGAYDISVGGTMADSGKTWIAVVNTVAMTAQVNNSLSFIIGGVTSGSTTITGETLGSTSVATTATSIPWGVLSPGTPYVAMQTLSVTTNAQNGFTVTLQQNQPMTSGTGAIINNFANGASTSVPSVWTAPTGTMGSSNTYGHYGVTSDSNEGTNEFGSGGGAGTIKYAGNINSARTVMTASGPSDGVTTNSGFNRVMFKIQITSLQAAGNDYANTLTYIATPVF